MWERKWIEEFNLLQKFLKRFFQNIVTEHKNSTRSCFEALCYVFELDKSMKTIRLHGLQIEMDVFQRLGKCFYIHIDLALVFSTLFSLVLPLLLYWSPFSYFFHDGSNIFHRISDSSFQEMVVFESKKVLIQGCSCQCCNLSRFRRILYQGSRNFAYFDK